MFQAPNLHFSDAVVNIDLISVKGILPKPVSNAAKTEGVRAWQCVCQHHEFPTDTA